MRGFSTAFVWIEQVAAAVQGAQLQAAPRDRTQQCLPGFRLLQQCLKITVGCGREIARADLDRLDAFGDDPVEGGLERKVTQGVGKQTNLHGGLGSTRIGQHGSCRWRRFQAG